jgi:hypothetical protein
VILRHLGLDSIDSQTQLAMLAISVHHIGGLRLANVLAYNVLLGTSLGTLVIFLVALIPSVSR